MGYVPKSKDPFVFHHLAVCEDGEFNMKAAGYLPEEVENLLPVGAKYNLPFSILVNPPHHVIFTLSLFFPLFFSSK